MKKLLLALVALTSSISYATADKGSQVEGKARVKCEYRLTKNLAKDSLNQMRDSVFGIPFTWKSSDPYAKDAAYAALGLKHKPNAEEISRLLVSLNQVDDGLHPVRMLVQIFTNGTLHDLSTQPFPDSTPSVWRNLRLTSEEVRLTYPELVAAYPITAEMLESEQTHIGFHTDVDSNGIRRFVETGNLHELVLGIDVPCDQLDYYSTHGDGTGGPDVVRTPATHFCRVPVLHFGSE